MAAGLGSGIGDQEQALQEETDENRHIRLTIDDFYEVAWLTQSSIVNCVDIALLLPQIAATKHSLREITNHSATGDNKRVLGDFIEQWFSEEAESRRQILLKSLVTPAKE